MSPEKRRSPPYIEIEYIPAPRAAKAKFRIIHHGKWGPSKECFEIRNNIPVVGATNAEPIEAATTTPRPMANGPAIIRNLSDGAHAATADKPPTMPNYVQYASRNQTGGKN